jgi:hypothetical protein
MSRPRTGDSTAILAAVPSQQRPTGVQDVPRVVCFLRYFRKHSTRSTMPQSGNSDRIVEGQSVRQGGTRHGRRSRT